MVEAGEKTSNEAGNEVGTSKHEYVMKQIEQVKQTKTSGETSENRQL
jgi:hypothetical protein